jgi:DnaJ-class molecular chaperone
MNSYYRVLGIDSTADDAALKAAFRRLARRHHPDIGKGKRSARRFLVIRKAYEVLAHRPPLRRIGLDVERGEVQAPGGVGSGGFGITLDVLGLRMGRLAVGAEVIRPRTKRQGAPRRLSGRPKRGER